MPVTTLITGATITTAMCIFLSNGRRKNHYTEWEVYKNWLFWEEYTATLFSEAKKVDIYSKSGTRTFFSQPRKAYSRHADRHGDDERSHYCWFYYNHPTLSSDIYLQSMYLKTVYWSVSCNANTVHHHFSNQLKSGRQPPKACLTEVLVKGRSQPC